MVLQPSVNDSIPEVTDFGIGMGRIPQESRSIYVVTENSDDWHSGFEFDTEKPAFKKSSTLIKKGKDGYIFKIYLDGDEKRPLAVFAYVSSIQQFKRII